jgi:hypothetical protein
MNKPVGSGQYALEYYNVMRERELFVSLQTGVVLTEEYNVVVNSEKCVPAYKKKHWSVG